MAIRTHRISLYYADCHYSFSRSRLILSISHEEAVSAFEQNISALALAAQAIPRHIIHIIYLLPSSIFLPYF